MSNLEIKRVSNGKCNGKLFFVFKKQHCRYSKEPSHFSLYTEEETLEKNDCLSKHLFWNLCDVVCFKILNKLSFPDPNTKCPFQVPYIDIFSSVTSLI